MELLGRLKDQGVAVVAIAQACGRRTILKDVAVMAAAIGTVIFRAGHQQRHIATGGKGAGPGVKKAGPTSAAVEFHVGGKQHRAATSAFIDTFTLFIVERTGKRALSAMLAQDMVLLWREAPCPFRLAKGDGIVRVVFHEAAPLLLYPKKVVPHASLARGTLIRFIKASLITSAVARAAQRRG